MHGTGMVFFVMVPVLAGLANFLVPLQIGAPRHGVPAAERALVLALRVRRARLLLSFFASGGAANTGWTAYPPLSLEALGNGQDLWILSIHILTISSAVGAINFIVTIHNMRTRGMSWMRIPLFVWSVEVYAWLLHRRPARALGRADDAAARAAVPRHVPLLPTRGDGRRRLTDPVPARVLVLRAPRGLHHGAARVRDHLRGHPGVRAQADLRLQGGRVLDRRDRLLLDARVGAPHVRGRACRRT